LVVARPWSEACGSARIAARLGDRKSKAGGGAIARTVAVPLRAAQGRAGALIEREGRLLLLRRATSPSTAAGTCRRLCRGRRGPAGRRARGVRGDRPGGRRGWPGRSPLFADDRGERYPDRLPLSRDWRGSDRQRRRSGPHLLRPQESRRTGCVVTTRRCSPGRTRVGLHFRLEKLMKPLSYSLVRSRFGQFAILWKEVSPAAGPTSAHTTRRDAYRGCGPGRVGRVPGSSPQSRLGERMAAFLTGKDVGFAWTCWRWNSAPILNGGC